MDEKQIQQIVTSVLSKLGEQAPTGKVQVIPSGAGSTSDLAQAGSMTGTSQTSSAPVADDGASLEDLGSDKFKKWMGMESAHISSVNEDLLKQTGARICVGRAGPRPRTIPLLRFLADHARSKDTVIKEVSAEWLNAHDLPEVQSQIINKDEYLTRPDLGRKLSAEARQLIKDKGIQSPTVHVVISDGLSTDAVTANYEELLPPLLKGLENAGLKLGRTFFLRYGRVKAQDEIGELLDAEANILLIGERPGLGQSESLSCYAIYRPNSETVESDRTVISNIHQGGTPPVEAAAVIVDLVKAMLEQKASGTNLKR